MLGRSSVVTSSSGSGCTNTVVFSTGNRVNSVAGFFEVNLRMGGEEGVVVDGAILFSSLVILSL